MPFIDPEALANATRTGTPEAPKEPVEVSEDTSSFLEAGKAIYALEDPIFNLTREAFLPEVSDELDRDFDPIQKLQEERPDLINHIDRFVTVKNEEEYRRKQLNIDYENEQREIIAKAPLMTTIAAGLATAVVDPLTLVPVAGAGIKAYKAGRIAAGAATGVGVAAGAASVREGILQGTQETRTLEESLYNVAAEAAFGGLIGGGAAAMSNPVKSAGKQILGKALAGEDYKINVTETGEVSVARSVGAAEKASELEELGLAHINEKLAKTISGPEFIRSPDLRAILSPSESTRKLGEVFYNSNYIRNKHTEGLSAGENAQNAIARRERATLQTLKQVDQLYTNYTGKGALGSTIALPQGKIKHAEFSKRVWHSLVDDTRVDNIPEVNKAAALIRKDMDAMAKELQAAKLLPEDLDPKFMRNYMTRVYDTDVLMNPTMQRRFIEKVSNWMKRHNRDGSIRAIPLDDDTARDAANETLSRIRGETDQQIAMSSIAEGFITKGKFIKERQLLIPDSEISEFLQTDSFRLYKNYMGRAGKLVETQKALNRAGFDSVQDVVSQIRNEAATATRGLTDSPEDLAKAKKIGQSFADQERLVNLMYRSMLGQLRKPGKADRYAETLLNYQFVRLLGGVTISSLPEMVMVPFRQGFLKTLRDGYLPMLRSFKSARLTKDQLNDLTGALEFEGNNVLRALGGLDDIDNLGRNQSKWDVAMQMTTDTFTKASLIGHWTSAHRRVAAQVASADIIRTLKRGPQGSDIQRLATLGISKTDYERLTAAINKHTQEYKGSYALNPHLWEDKGALNIIKNAIQNEIESAILKPGVEALPFFVQQNQWAKVLFQFKSFMSAASGKITISGIQRRDANVLMGLVGLIAMGSVSEVAHKLLKGEDLDEALENPDELLLAGLDRSGVLGLMGTTVLGTTRAFYSEDTRRFGGKFVSSNILGPSAGQIEELVKTLERNLDGEVTDKDIKAVTRMIPFMNLFYIKTLTEQALDEE